MNPLIEKQTRSRFSLIVKETERALNKHFRRHSPTFKLAALQAQVALNLSLPVSQVEAIVQAYVEAREDLLITSQHNVRRRR